MSERVTDNRGVAVALLAVVGGSLASVTVMSRGSVSPLIVLPAIPILFALGVLPKLVYATTVILVVDGTGRLERRTPWSVRKVDSPRIDFVRYRVRFATSQAGKKFYLGLDAQRSCQFTLEAALWSEADVARLATLLRGELRGNWTNVIDVDRVASTFGGAYDRW